MSDTNIILLIGDCLRAANADERTLPNSIANADIELTNCYSPGTWTLPTHASLYTATDPIEHGTLRPDHKLSERPVVPEHARQHGYTTALFSENPTFGPHRGFDAGIDYCDSEINYKLFRSSFSPTEVADSPSVTTAPKIFRESLTSPGGVRNLVNLAYGTYERYWNSHPNKYPHHGQRVLSHLGEYLVEQTDPVFAFVNLLDPHNPHYAQPPATGADPLGITVSPEESEAFASINSKDVLLADSPLPDNVREFYDSYEAVYERHEEIYEGQIRYMDSCIGEWLSEHKEELADSLILITGDHGHLFYEEEMLEHHSSLHPGGVQVPLYVSLPDSWETKTETIDTPVSLTEVIDALCEVVAADDEFTSTLCTSLRESSPPLVVADGPTWNVEDLLETYDWDQVRRLAKSSVGIPTRDEMTVYESDWRTDEITEVTYDVSPDSRSERNRRIVSKDEVPSKIADWLLDSREFGMTRDVSDRLRQLGYV